MIFGFGKSKPKSAKREPAKSESPAPKSTAKPAPAGSAKAATTTWYGRLEKQQMIGVVWVLHGEDALQYELRGVTPDAALDGQRVAVVGTLAEAGFGMQMVGTPIDVTTIEAAPAQS